MTCTVTTRSPSGPPAVPGRPLPRSRIFWPSRTPGGMRVVTVRPSTVNVTVDPSTACRNGRVVAAARSAPARGRGPPNCWPAPPPNIEPRMSSNPPVPWPPVE
ncbi:Uncharacterised protein [Mycobacteroides abscessus]|nr:Uncharacterised protein [Mycobacteroides abscessus]